MRGFEPHSIIPFPIWNYYEETQIPTIVIALSILLPIEGGFVGKKIELSRLAEMVTNIRNGSHVDSYEGPHFSNLFKRGFRNGRTKC